MPKVSTNEELLKAVVALNNSVSKLDERLVALENPAVNPVVEEVVPIQVEEDSDPVPFEFRQVVDEVLNKFFEVRVKNGAKISENVDGFVFSVVVPDKYSTASEFQKQSVGGDLRVKAIPYALREIGVREWCDKVWKTFNEDIQGQITEDRLKDAI
mgnify:CR=1 FL=1